MPTLRIALVLLGSALTLFGSEARAEISESKRLLIRELIQLSGGGQAAEQVAQSFLAQIRHVYGSMVDEVVASESDLSAEEKQALREHLADFDRFASAFSARFAERIDLDAALEAVYVPLYDRYFAETELREIVAFYRTPAGRKMIAVLPSLMQDGLESTVTLVQPKVMALVGEILADRRTGAAPLAAGSRARDSQEPRPRPRPRGCAVRRHLAHPTRATWQPDSAARGEAC